MLLMGHKYSEINSFISLDLHQQMEIQTRDKQFNFYISIYTFKNFIQSGSMIFWNEDLFVFFAPKKIYKRRFLVQTEEVLRLPPTDQTRTLNRLTGETG